MKTHAIVAGAEDVLQQGLALLAELDAQSYAAVLDPPYGASIGQHYRHVLDHFLCLVMGMGTGAVDYDRRSRDRRIEVDLEHARALTLMLLEQFQGLTAKALARSCRVIYSVGYRESAPQRLRSTVGRELAFAAGHAIHHFALVKLLCAQLAVRVPAEFGVAPSTLKHRATQSAS